MTRTRDNTLGRTVSTLTLLYAAACILPVLMLFWSWQSFNKDSWDHLLTYLLPAATARTALLCTVVLLATAILGVSSAFFIGCFEFPGRSLLRVLLTLPLALPNYVIGFAVLSVIDYTGPVGIFDQWAGTTVALWLHQNNWVPAAISLTFGLYPYVYLMTLASIETQNRSPIEAAMLDGANAMQILRKIILPLTGPSVSAGLLLVLMETLADFGTVATFSYDTYAVLIYKVWYGLFDLDTAAQLAIGMIFLIMPLVLIRARWMQHAHATLSVDYQTFQFEEPSRLRRWLLCAALTSVLLIAFGVPIVTLAIQSIRYWPSLGTLIPVIGHTVTFAALAAVGALVSAAIQTFLRSRSNSRKTRIILLEYANLGYALPGTILAVGVLMVITQTSHLFPFLTGTIAAGIIGLVCRFQIISAQSLWAGFLRVPRSLAETARIDGAGPMATFRCVYAPFMRAHIVVAFVLVFLETAKEMPITLMTRPFGQDTLAVKIFQFTSEGEYGMAAVPALLLAIIGLLPQVVFIVRRRRHI